MSAMMWARSRVVVIDFNRILVGKETGGGKDIHFPGGKNVALASASLNPSDIDYVTAHGTSTLAGDIAETQAIKSVFQDHSKKLAVTSTKSMIGHLLGASGAAEAIVSILSLRDQVLSPTINLDTPAEGCDLDYVPHTARDTTLNYALSNSFGFGGTNGCLIFARHK